MIGAIGKSKRYHVRRKSKHFFVGFIACFFSFQSKGEHHNKNEQPAGSRFSWNEHRKLSWNDFKGPVAALSNESAAATCCSIGFRLDSTATGNPQVSVYNTFYIDKSWVKEDAKIQSILTHEQGHFDLCELYTRKLRLQVNAVDLRSQNAKQTLMNVYAALSAEYETHQQTYEHETAHGTNIAAQQKWEEMISDELNELEASL